MPKKSEQRSHSSHPGRKVLAQYRDDELCPAERGRVQDHVSSCVHCRGEFFDLCGWENPFETTNLEGSPS